MSHVAEGPLKNLMSDDAHGTRRAGRSPLSRKNSLAWCRTARAIESVRPQAQKKGLELCSDIAQAIGRISSDSRRVKQILLNLLINVVKFTSHGNVAVKCGIDPKTLLKLAQEFDGIDLVMTGALS